MKRRGLLAALAFTAATLLRLRQRRRRGAGQRGKPRPRSAAAAAPSPARTLTVDCQSPSLGGTMPAQVYLPVGIRVWGAAIRVVYFLHGLPAGPSSYQQNAFVASALASAGQQAIVVAPQGARDADCDREYLDWDAAEDWPQAISDDLPPASTTASTPSRGRYGRALVGLSAGGYGAMNIGLRNLQRFGAVQSWSGYFVATNPGRHAGAQPRLRAGQRCRHGAERRAAQVPAEDAGRR